MCNKNVEQKKLRYVRGTKKATMMITITINNPKIKIVFNEHITNRFTEMCCNSYFMTM